MFGGSIGSLATLSYEPRQDRKVATVVDTMCAEDVLIESLFLCLAVAFDRQTAHKNIMYRLFFKKVMGV